MIFSFRLTITVTLHFLDTESKWLEYFAKLGVYSKVHILCEPQACLIKNILSILYLLLFLQLELKKIIDLVYVCF